MFSKPFLIKLIIAFVVIISVGCYNRFNIITSENSYKWVREKDSIVKKDTLIFIYNQQDSMYGNYQFIVLPGYEGRSLILSRNYSFNEKAWTDVVYPWKTRGINGRWKYDKGKVILKHFYKEIPLKVHQYSWATFLVPESKAEIFAHEFNKNKYIIDSLASHVYEMSGSEIHKCLSDLRTLCYIRRVNNKFEKFTN